MTPIPIWRRYARMFGPDPAADVKDELSFHLQAKIDDLVRQGWQPRSRSPRSRTPVRRPARRPTRSALRIGEEMERRKRLKDYWSDSLQDVRYTFRTLGRDPGFAAISILILALAIGANVAVFSVVNTLLLRPLPFPDSQRARVDRSAADQPAASPAPPTPPTPTKNSATRAAPIRT